MKRAESIRVRYPEIGASRDQELHELERGAVHESRDDDRGLSIDGRADPLGGARRSWPPVVIARAVGRGAVPLEEVRFGSGESSKPRGDVEAVLRSQLVGRVRLC
jgi:hypothetical protein